MVEQDLKVLQHGNGSKCHEVISHIVVELNPTFQRSVFSPSLIGDFDIIVF
jgi:hypothetical protein